MVVIDLETKTANFFFNSMQAKLNWAISEKLKRHMLSRGLEITFKESF